ncbi:MAG TPA: LAGLIDADG family homing endonuclease [Mycoplasmatales bacterium]|jgi:hypothetical protein|nr:LAGLIDADG family homing endonuclease [Mycoplasmatales bacterium]
MNDWLVGFTDGEGCFSISFNLRKKIKVGIETRPSFSISQKRDKDLINHKLVHSLVEFFQGGFIRFSNIDQIWKYETRNIDHICDRIIPFFEKNKLKTAKKLDFDKFKIVCQMIRSNHHISHEGILKVIEISFAMNHYSKRKYSKEFLLKSLEKVKI